MKNSLSVRVLAIIVCALIPFLEKQPLLISAIIVASVAIMVFAGVFFSKIYRPVLNINLTDLLVCAFLIYGAINSCVRGNGLSGEQIGKWGALLLVYGVSRIVNLKNEFIYGTVLGGVMQSVIGLLQFCSFIPSKTFFFQITGSFYNPGPYAGYLAFSLICTVICLVNLVRCNQKGLRGKCSVIFLFVAGILIVSMLLASDSRSAIIAVIVGLGFFSTYNLGRKKKIIGGVVLVTVIAVALLKMYSYKQDSADGRLLIWKVSCDMIAEKPILGHTLGAFDRLYMLYQMEFFRENPDSPFIQVAGHTKFPYNEFIHVVVEHGIVGLILLIVLLASTLYSNENDFGSICVKSLIVGWLGFGMFSYPNEVFTLILILAFIMGSVRSKVVYRLNVATAVVVFCAIIVVGGITIRTSLIDYKLDKSLTEKSVLVRRKLLMEEKLAAYIDNNYNSLLKKPYHYDKCVVELCSLSRDTAGVEKLLYNLSPTCSHFSTIGDLYTKCCIYDKAELYYLNAHYMVPNMITPLYNLFKMYRSKGDASNAAFYANKVLNHKVKIENTKTLKAKKDARDFLVGMPYKNFTVGKLIEYSGAK